MQRHVYIKFESRDNMGLPDKVVERLAIFDDKDDPTYLAETLASWASETGQTMATVLTVSKAQAKQHLKRHVSGVVKPSDTETKERERVKGLFNGRAKPES
jgi:hypothetical protein